MATIKFSKAALKNVNIEKTFEKVARIIINAMQRHIKNKTDVNGYPVKSNAKSTIKQKGFDHRMVNTGAFVRNAYVSEALPKYLIITLRNAPHPKGRGATYLQIGGWNQAGAPQQAVKGASDHFGMDKDTEYKVTKIIADALITHIDKTMVYKTVIEEVV